MACGRRWGKTAAGLISILRGHGAFPGQHAGASNTPRGVFWWVAPNTTEISNSGIWRDLKRACSLCWVDKSEQRKEITLDNGTVIAVRSADAPDSLRGPGIDGLVIDEAAMLKADVWPEVLRPALSDKQGWAMFCSTPKGPNWFSHFYRRGQPGSKHIEGWKSWRLPTSQNPVVTQEELEKAKEDMGPRAFAQEHEAQFMEVKGAMWPPEYFGDHVWATRWPDMFDLSAVAVDPSMGESEKSDPSAIVFVGISGGILWVEADIRVRNPGDLVQDTASMFRRYQPDGLGVEWVACQGLLGELLQNYAEKYRLPPFPIYKMKCGKADKTKRISRLDPHLSNRRIRILDNPGGIELHEQMMMFPLPSYHDDGPDALEMGIRLMNNMVQGAPPRAEHATA